MYVPKKLVHPSRSTSNFLVLLQSVPSLNNCLITQVFTTATESLTQRLRLL